MQRANNRAQYDDIVNKIFRLRELKAQAKSEGFKQETSLNRITELCDFLREQPQELSKFDDKLFQRFLEKVTIYDDHLTVELKSGINLDINL